MPLLLATLLATAANAQVATRYALVLAEPPAAAAARRSEPARVAAARSRIRSAHETVKAELRSRNIRISGEVDTLLNAIFITATPAEAAALGTIPGVAGAIPLRRLHRNLDAAVQVLNVPPAWRLPGAFTHAGAGVKIAIIDTGIDSSHPAFQDATLTPPSGFPRCGAMADCAYTNSKVIVARSYIQLLSAGSLTNPAADSRPDDLSARDRWGHGTAVAMAAAGATNTGPGDTITGLAPKAYLGNYKVFGSPGVLDFTTEGAVISALDDAFNDGMDIAVLSLGGPAVYGPLDTGAACGLATGVACDADAMTVENAVKAGMLVIAAAGNEGTTGIVFPSLGSLDSPGDAPSAIAVAAVSNAHNWSAGLTVNGLGNFHSQLGDGPPPAGVLTAPLSDSASAGDPQACTTLPAGSLSGTIALVVRGPCPFLTKVQSLQGAGAVGVIITNNPGDDSILAPGGLAGQTTIPAAFVGYTDGQTIRAYLTAHLSANLGATASLTNVQIPFPVTTSNQMAGFSSRGPALGNLSVVKPDVAAVGTNLYLAAQKYDPNGELYSASGYVVSQGTSFSAPQIAGVAALVLEANPGFTTAQLKSAVVNTASSDVTDSGAAASVLAAGSGRANAAAAVATTLVASPASVSFGAVKSATLQVSMPIQLSNTGTANLGVSVTFDKRTPETTAHVTVDQPNPQIAAGSTATINLLLSGALPTPGIYEGFVVVQQGSGSLLRIPYFYIVPDGVPHNIVPTAGNGDIGLVGGQNSEGGLLFQVLDRYGVPVSGLPVTFGAATAGGSLSNPDQVTDSYGFAGANDLLGPNPGTYTFTAAAGGLNTSFSIIASQQPVIVPKGAVNAASYAAQPVAPGSYISLFGTNLANAIGSFFTSYLPVAINQVSVSFDTPAVSAPGHLTYVSPNQLVVQVPWELQSALAAGQTAAQIKASISFNSGAVYNLPLATYSPAFFESPVGFVAALDQNNQAINTSNAVAQGSVVQLFVNGLGPVTNQPASGDPSPLNPLAQTVAAPTVIIGGLTAPVQFSGMTPGAVGLYQINAVVPNTGSGLQQITVSIGGVQSPVSHLQVR